MADVVADVLQGEMGVQQALHAVAPQYVGARARHANAGLTDEIGGASDYRRGSNRGDRSADAHEHLTACREPLRTRRSLPRWESGETRSYPHSDALPSR
jgi:hypothetical protein